MKILIISDIHANITALEAVIKHAGHFDATWCLGDLVGYGPDPEECINQVRSLQNLTCLMGNHDAAVVERIPLDAFNVEAKKSIHWMQDNISAENFNFLSNLPDHHNNNIATLAHGSPRNPIWEYILDTNTAMENFGFFKTPICFVGHTHLPIAYFYSDEKSHIQWKLLQTEETTTIKNRAILNPGSVGQPRDRDPRSSYAIFDPDELSWKSYRVEYDIIEVQKRIYQTDLPARNAIRLSQGW